MLIDVLGAMKNCGFRSRFRDLASTHHSAERGFHVGSNNRIAAQIANGIKRPRHGPHNGMNDTITPAIADEYDFARIMASHH